ncbi:MAG TPA: flagellar hook-length control protein FliK [Albitalea sp.]
MQLVPTAIAPAPAPSPQAGPRTAAPAEQAAFSKVLAARQRDARAADTRHSQAAEARAQQSRRQDAARDGAATRGAAETEAPETASPRPADEMTAAAAPGSDPTAAQPGAPTLVELLAALNRTPADDAGPASEGAAMGATASASRGARTPAALPPGSRSTDTQPRADAAQPLAAPAREGHDALEAAEEAIAGTDTNPARAEARGEAAQAAPATSPAPLPAVHAAPRAELAAAPPSVTLSTPVTAPEFREALGVQVSVLARGGVQQAELHLNPAEMGPILVQIALEGTQAQVQFGADSPATRQLIEAGLPELAAALRDAGFTLSGGGVSQHSRGQAEGAAPDHGAAGAPAGDEGTLLHAAAAAPHGGWRLPQGAVDLYA